MGRAMLFVTVLSVCAGAVICQTSTAASAGTSPLPEHVQQPCACKNGFSKIIKVCGNDNVTYTNACDLANRMKKNPALGLRCPHKCPCADMAKIAATIAAAIPGAGCNAQRMSMRSAKAKRPTWFTPSSIQDFCLVGAAVPEATRRDVYCKMAANEKIGIRCMDKCSACGKEKLEICPGRFLQDIPMFEDPPASATSLPPVVKA